MKNDYKRKYNTFYTHLKKETVINESGTDDVFVSIYTAIISSIQKILGKDSGYTTDSAINHCNNTIVITMSRTSLRGILHYRVDWLSRIPCPKHAPYLKFKVTATGFEPTTTQFINKHITI